MTSAATTTDHAVGRDAEPGVGGTILAGVVAALVGFASTFAVVLAGLEAVGATPAQAASGLLALCLGMGITGVALAVRWRLPVAVAWSTPGAVLLVSAGGAVHEFPAAVGAFLVAAALTVLAGLVRPLERAVAAIPVPLASGMLAGVLLPVCLAPVRAVVELPLLAVPTVLVWLLLTRVARRWAVPGAVVAAAVALLATRGVQAVAAPLLPSVVLTRPVLDAGAVLGLALPLFVVTMASQNIPGMGVLASFGYRPPLRPVLAATGFASAVTAPFGAHGINLAALTAALIAGPEAHPNPDRRWVAAAANGGAYMLFAALAPGAAALAGVAPPLLVQAVAGLALLGALAGALAAATGEAALAARERDAAVVTLVVTASAIPVAGISAPFWGLLAGLAVLGVERVGRRAR